MGVDTGGFIMDLAERATADGNSHIVMSTIAVFNMLSFNEEELFKAF